MIDSCFEDLGQRPPAALKSAFAAKLDGGEHSGGATGTD